MPFAFEQTGFEGLVKVLPRQFDDDRGWFLESYKHSDFAAAGIDVHFVQDNHSCSMEGTLRGLHYQIGPRAQGKLVRVISGAVYDVAVDVRRKSPTFGRWFGMQIGAAGGEMLWIAPGFAHGFLALEDNTQLIYKCTAEYDKEIERSIRWDDPTLGIDWPSIDGADYLLSPKDAAAPPLADAEVFA